MVYFARCPACGAVNDATSRSCYLCAASPLIVACAECGAEVRNPVRTICTACGSPYRLRNPGAAGAIHHQHLGNGQKNE